LGASRRGEPGKNRPAVVVSVDRLNTASAADLVVVVPLSSSSASSALRPEVTDVEGVDQASRAICRAVRGVTPSRLLRRLGVLPVAMLTDIEQALVLILGLSPQ
jgi:mRNA interferase MazF